MRTSVTAITRWVFMAIVLLLSTAQPVFADLLPQTDGPVIESLPERPLYGPEAALAMNWTTPPAVETQEGSLIEWSGVPWSEMVYQSLDFREAGEDWDLWMTDSSTGSTYQLFDTDIDEVQPRLSRGGQEVVFVQINGELYEIYKYNLITHTTHRLTYSTTEDLNPSWAPNGQKIVYESYKDGQAEIYVMNADGSGKVRLTNNAGGSNYDYDGMPSWSPDGTQIAFISKRTGGYRVWIMNADGTNPHMVSTQAYSAYPIWKPDGSAIVFSCDSTGDSFYDVWRVTLENNSESAICGNDNIDYRPSAYSPDGNQLAGIRVQYVNYNGTWYWTDAQAGIISGSWGFTPIVPGNYVWNADWQTLDNIPPTASLKALPAISPAPPALVPYVYDGQSGISTYTLERQAGLYGEWELIMPDSEYQGGQTYYFRIQAYDNGGNVDKNSGYDTFTAIESEKPITSIRPLADYTKTDRVFLQIQGNDLGGSGIKAYYVQYRLENSTVWNDLSEGTQQTVKFDGMSGSTYYFRVAAIDKANNQESWPDDPKGDATTTIYYRSVGGRVYSNTENPVSSTTITTSPSAMDVITSSQQGHYLGYFPQNSSNPFTISWWKPGYGELPDTTFTGTEDVSMDAYLPPADNIILNWDFEENPNDFTQWNATGVYAPSLNTDRVHTGINSAKLGLEPELADTFPMPSNCQHITASDTDTQGRIHVLCANGYYMAYFNETWSTPIKVFNGSNYDPVLLASADGRLHIVYLGGSRELFYVWRDNYGAWYSATLIKEEVNSNDSFQAAVDPTGGVHITLSTDDTHELWYYHRWANGDWERPQRLKTSDTRKPLLAISPSNLPIIAYSTVYTDEHYYHMYLIEQLPSGAWTNPVQLDEGYGIDHMYLGCLEDNSLVYLYRHGYIYSVKQRMPNRVWTNSIDDPTQYSNAYVNTVVVDANKMMHLFRIRTDALPGFNLITNRWDVSNILKLRYPTDFVYSQDSDKRLHILHRSQDYALGYTYQLSNGLWYGTKLTIPISSYHTYVSFIGIDNQKQPIFVWTTSPSGESQYSYLERYTPQSGNSILSQTVNLPDGQTFLSFMYANANNPSSNVPLRVTINANGETSEILTVVPEIDFKWKHATIDLSAWAGQTVTLSFETNQIAGELRTAYYIDEVSIGTGYTDIWARSASVNAMPGDQVTMQIHYGNRSMVDAGSSTLTLTLPAGLTLLDANPPADEPGGSTWTMDSIPAYANGVITLNLEVSAEVPMFDALIGDVSITTSDELETANNYGQLLIRVGNYLFLPAICR